ncbi:hypothetical protein ACOSQ4_022773 [Xanthoceras sorbifolium]
MSQPLEDLSLNPTVDTLQEKSYESIIQKNVEHLKAPYIGILFETLEEARDYYENYGRQEGFWIRTRSSSKTREGINEVTSRQFVCAHQGKYVPKIKRHDAVEENSETETNEKDDTMKRGKKCSTIKCGCEASMRIVRDKWSDKWKVSVFKDIHNLKIVSPARRMKMKSNKYMPKAAKRLTETFQRENLQIGKVCSILGGQDIGFDSRDCYNHLRNQAENPQFFYAIQCDEDGRATNFFWVDSRSRMAYHYFGDVVTFDTTYRTNKYDMPFAPFTGVNHHLQLIQFGSMGGHHSVSIITDQDFTMRGAIAKVFPNTHHRLCLWHIKKKFVEKLSHIKEFEEQWKTLMMENGLENNEWLNHLYEIRTSWVPVYNRSIFFAGMNTTGRSEGINSFFDGFVTSTTNLKEFVVKYELALKKIMERESKEDFESEHKYRIVNDGELLLKCAAQLYTRKTKYGEPEEFVVKLNLQNYKGTCECQNFEFIGILCRHFLKVFVRLDIDTIPDHFILTRWRQEANKFTIMDSEYLVKNDGKEKSEALRLSHMCHQATKLACVATSSNEAYKTYMETLKELSKKLSDVYEDQIDVLQKKDDPGTQIHSSPSLLLDPNISQTKGRKKDNKNSGRLKSGIELAFNKKKRQCALCRKFGHDKRICASNPQRRKIESTNFAK